MHCRGHMWDSDETFKDSIRMKLSITMRVKWKCKNIAEKLNKLEVMEVKNQ